MPAQIIAEGQKSEQRSMLTGTFGAQLLRRAINHRKKNSHSCKSVSPSTPGCISFNWPPSNQRPIGLFQVAMVITPPYISKGIYTLARRDGVTYADDTGSTCAGVGVHTVESRSCHVPANDSSVRVSDQITATRTTFSGDLTSLSKRHVHQETVPAPAWIAEARIERLTMAGVRRVIT